MDEASAVVIGIDSYLREVAILRKARIVTHENPTFSTPESLLSSQGRARLCSLASVSYA